MQTEASPLLRELFHRLGKKVAHLDYIAGEHSPVDFKAWVEDCAGEQTILMLEAKTDWKGWETRNLVAELVGNIEQGILGWVHSTDIDMLAVILMDAAKTPREALLFALKPFRT